MVIWPVSSSNKGLNKDEIKRNDYFPMQLVRLFDNQSVTNLWFIYGPKLSKFYQTMEIE